MNTQAQNDDPWVKYMTPNALHTTLSGYTGAFNMEITMWMAEGKDPSIVNVATVNKMIMGNRFLEIEQKGDMMGMKYEGRTTLGFNTISETLHLTTLTNMGTGTLSLTGDYRADKKTASLSGIIINPVDGKAIKVRQELSFVDKDTLLIENFDTYEGKEEKKSIQYKFTRKKK